MWWIIIIIFFLYYRIIVVHASYLACSPKAHSKRGRLQGGNLVQSPHNPLEVEERWMKETPDGIWSERRKRNCYVTQILKMICNSRCLGSDILWHGRQSCWRGRCVGHSLGWGRWRPPACYVCRWGAGTVFESQRWHASLWWSPLCPASWTHLAAVL